MKTEQDHRQAIVDVGSLMHQKGWVAANDGNISLRLDGHRLLCTPTGVSKGRLSADDLIICDLQGNKIKGERACTSEIAMHVAIYRLRPDVQSVVHTHAPVATGFAAAGRALDLALLPEVVVSLGSVPLADYGLPGTPALTEALLPYIPTHDAILMRNHGVVCYGDDVWSAYYKMETVEHFARIMLVAELLGSPQVLSRHEVTELFQSRARYGVRSNAHAAPGRPRVAEDWEATQPQPPQFTKQELLALVEETLQVKISVSPTVSLAGGAAKQNVD